MDHKTVYSTKISDNQFMMPETLDDMPAYHFKMRSKLKLEYDSSTATSFEMING